MVFNFQCFKFGIIPTERIGLTQQFRGHTATILTALSMLDVKRCSPESRIEQKKYFSLVQLTAGNTCHSASTLPGIEKVSTNTTPCDAVQCTAIGPRAEAHGK